MLFEIWNDLCRDCGKTVEKKDRQELVTDYAGRWRRLCAACIAKLDQKQRGKQHVAIQE